MSMLEEIWLSGLDDQDRPVKKGSAMERKLCLYAKNSDRMSSCLLRLRRRRPMAFGEP